MRGIKITRVGPDGATVPLYDTLGENAVAYIVNHAGVELVFVDASKLHEYTKVR